MIRLFDYNRHATSKNEALIRASDYTGFNKDDFKCEVIKEPKRTGLFKREDGLYRCWYEYQGMNSDKELVIVDTTIYVDIMQKKILVIRHGFRSYELDCTDLIDYEIVVASGTQSRKISSKDNALKGGILFGVTGAIIGATDSETVTSTSEVAELIIRLRFKNKESFEILTCNQKYNTANKEWRDVLDQGKIADEFFRELLEEM